MALITSNEVISLAFSSREVINSNIIRPTKIDIAQEHFIRPRIGDIIFDRIDNGELEDFVDLFIKPSLAYFVRYSVIEELTVSLGDNGSIVYSGSNVQDDATEVSSQSRDVKKDITDNNTSTDKTETTETHSHEKDELCAVDKNDNNTSKNTLAEYKEGGDMGLFTTTTTNSAGNLTSERREEGGKNVTSETKSTRDVIDKNIGQSVSNTVVASKDTDKITKSDTSIDKNISQTIQTDCLNIEAENKNKKTAKNFTPAPKDMVHQLQIRALSDANILLNKAIRIIKQNPKLFGEFTVDSNPFYF